MAETRGIQYVIHHPLSDLNQVELCHRAILAASHAERLILDWWSGDFYTHEAARGNRARLAERITELEQIAQRIRSLMRGAE